MERADLRTRSAAAAVASGALIAALLVGCYTPRPVKPLLDEPLELSPAEARGELVFMRNCHECHPHGSQGVGVAIAGFPEAAVAAQVRLGVGTMPEFPEALISDQELDVLTDYVEALGRAEADEEGSR